MMNEKLMQRTEEAELTKNDIKIQVTTSAF